MTTRRDISLNVIADISKYQQQFAKVPGFTDKQAAKAAEKLEKRMSKAAADSARAAQKAAQKSARAFEKAGSGPRGLAASLDNVAEKSGDVDSIISGLGGALGAIDPRLQAVATGFQDAAGGIEAVAKGGMLSIPAMGAVGIAVAALGAAYLVLAHDVEEAEKAQERAAKRATAAQAAFGGFAAAIRTLDTEILKLTGSYDENEEAARKRDTAFRRQAEASERFLQKEIAVNKAEQDRLKTLQREGDTSLETNTALNKVRKSLEMQEAQLVAIGQRSEEFAGKSLLLKEVLQEQAEEQIRAKEAAEALKRSQEGAARAAERLAEAQAKQKSQVDALIAAGKARNEQVERDITLSQQNAEIKARATRVELTAIGELARATDEQIAKAEEIRVQRIQNARGDNFLMLEAEREFQESKTALEEQFATERTEIAKREAEARKGIEEQEAIDLGNNLAKATQLTLSNTHQMLQGLQTLAADSKNQEQARRLFHASKVTGLGMVAVNTAIAITKAFADLGPVLGPVAAAAMAANGVVQAEVIRRQKPPTFYRGTSMVERPDGGAADAVPATLHAGEAVLNRRAAESMGRDQIEAMNAGRRSSGHQVVAISQINHRQFRSFYRDDRSLPGSLTRRDRNRDGTKIGRQL